MDYIVHGVAKSRTRLSDFHFPFLSWGWRGCVRSTAHFQRSLTTLWPFPAGDQQWIIDTVDKNLPANAGDTGSIPGPGGFYMLQSNCKPQLLSPWMATTEACAPWACAPQQMPPQWEAQARELGSSSHPLQLEKGPPAEGFEDPAQLKITKKKKKSCRWKSVVMFGRRINKNLWFRKFMDYTKCS